MAKGNEKSSQYTAAKARQFEPGDGGQKNASFTDGTALESPFTSGTAAARPAEEFTVTNERGVQRSLICTHFARTHTITDIQSTGPTTKKRSLVSSKEFSKTRHRVKNHTCSALSRQIYYG